jgi:hypothetical protein
MPKEARGEKRLATWIGKTAMRYRAVSVEYVKKP